MAQAPTIPVRVRENSADEGKLYQLSYDARVLLAKGLPAPRHLPLGHRTLRVVHPKLPEKRLGLLGGVLVREAVGGLASGTFHEDPRPCGVRTQLNPVGEHGL